MYTGMTGLALGLMALRYLPVLPPAGWLGVLCGLAVGLMFFRTYPVGLWLLGLVWAGSEFSSGGADPLAESYIPPRHGYFPTRDRAVSASADAPRSPALHPAVVAAMESLLCLTALAAFSDPRKWSATVERVKRSLVSSPGLRAAGKSENCVSQSRKRVEVGR